jgi:hypothetical protein
LPSALAALAVIALVALRFSGGIPTRQPRDVVPPGDGSAGRVVPGATVGQ